MNHVADVVVIGAGSVDVSVFDPARIDAGRPLVADHPYGNLWR